MQVSLGEEHGIKNYIREEEKKQMSSVDLVASGAFKIKRMYDVANNCEVCQSK